MSGNEEKRMVFTCPHCTARFQAVMMRSPKAYRCPHCKAPFTIFPDGDIQKGDRTKPRQTIEPIRPPSEVFSEDKGHVGTGPSPEGNTEEDEKALYREVLEQFKELSTRQRCLEEAGEQALEIKRLRRENERLMGEVFSLEQKVSSIEGNAGGGPEMGKDPVLERLSAENASLKTGLEEAKRSLEEHEVTKLELGLKIEQLEIKLKDIMDELASRTAPAGDDDGPFRDDIKPSRAGVLEDEARRLELWKKELDAYKVNLEEIALSLVNEKEDLERREAALSARERSLSGLGEREGRVTELEKALLEREEQLRDHLRGRSAGEASGQEASSPDKESQLGEREAAVRRVEDLLNARKAEMDARDAELTRRSVELTEQDRALKELERSLAERQESLEKARDRLRELKDRMHKELGSRKGADDAVTKQRKLRERLESKQVGIQEMESKIKDLLK